MTEHLLHEMLMAQVHWFWERFGGGWGDQFSQTLQQAIHLGFGLRRLTTSAAVGSAGSDHPHPPTAGGPLPAVCGRLAAGPDVGPVWRIAFYREDLAVKNPLVGVSFFGLPTFLLLH